MSRRPRDVFQPGIDALVARQDGVLSRDQLAHQGVSRAHIAQRVRTGRWQVLGPRVVVLATGALTVAQQMWAAVLHAGPGSVLADLTAAELGGLRGFEDSTRYVLVPHGFNARNLVVPSIGLDVRVRQSRRLAESLVQPAREPRRLQLAEAVVDAASRAAWPDRTRLLVIASVQQRLLRPDDVRRTVAMRPKLARRVVIIQSIDDVEGGLHSLPERAWDRARRRYRLPEPTRQQPVRRSDGTWYLDADFAPGGVGVEINGVQHLRAVDAVRDHHRRNVLGTGGRLMITLDSRTVRQRPGVAVVATAVALLSRGWQPDGRTLTALRQLAAAEGMDLATGDWRQQRPRRAS